MITFLLLLAVVLGCVLVHREANAEHPGRTLLALMIETAAVVLLFVHWL